VLFTIAVALFSLISFYVVHLYLREHVKEHQKVWELLDVLASGTGSAAARTLYAEIRNRKSFEREDLPEILRDLNRKNYERQRIRIIEAIQKAQDAEDYEAVERFKMYQTELDTMFTLIDCIESSSSPEYRQQIMNSIGASIAKINAIFREEET